MVFVAFLTHRALSFHEVASMFFHSLGNNVYIVLFNAYYIFKGSCYRASGDSFLRKEALYIDNAAQEYVKACLNNMYFILLLRLGFLR